MVKKLKSENAPPPDVEVAIKELKVRKKALENKVSCFSYTTIAFSSIIYILKLINNSSIEPLMTGCNMYHIKCCVRIPSEEWLMPLPHIMRVVFTTQLCT